MSAQPLSHLQRPCRSGSSADPPDLDHLRMDVSAFSMKTACESRGASAARRKADSRKPLEAEWLSDGYEHLDDDVKEFLHDFMAELMAANGSVSPIRWAKDETDDMPLDAEYLGVADAVLKLEVDAHATQPEAKAQATARALEPHLPSESRRAVGIPGFRRRAAGFQNPIDGGGLASAGRVAGNAGRALRPAARLLLQH